MSARAVRRQRSTISAKPMVQTQLAATMANAARASPNAGGPTWIACVKPDERDDRRREEQPDRHGNPERMTARQDAIDSDGEHGRAQHGELPGADRHELSLAGRRRPCSRSSRRRRASSSRCRRCWRTWSSDCSSPVRRPITSPAPTVTATTTTAIDRAYGAR